MNIKTYVKETNFFTKKKKKKKPTHNVVNASCPKITHYAIFQNMNNQFFFSLSFQLHINPPAYTRSFSKSFTNQQLSFLSSLPTFPRLAIAIVKTSKQNKTRIVVKIIGCSLIFVTTIIEIVGTTSIAGFQLEFCMDDWNNPWNYLRMTIQKIVQKPHYNISSKLS